MKKYFKYFVLLFVLGSYFLLEPVQNFFNMPLNYAYVTSYVAKTLYEEDVKVSSEKTTVKDYLVEGNRLYIFPLDGKVVLPVGVLIAGIQSDQLEVVDTHNRYIISHFKEKKVRLYEYVSKENALAYTQDFYIITGDQVSDIAARLEINYVQV